MLVIHAPALQRLHQDWEDRRRGRTFPARTDFAPDDLRYVLGDLALIDVLRAPLQFRYRLHPTNMATRLGADLTGKLIDEIADRRHFLLARAHCEEVVTSRRPVVKDRHGVKTDHRVWNCEVLALPLSTDGAEIDMLMACAIWDEVDDARRRAVSLPVS